MAEDLTMIATLVNMMANGCQMHANVFTTMGKGAPKFTIADNQLQIVISDGVYTVTVIYDAQLSMAREELAKVEQGAEDDAATKAKP